MRFIKKYIQSKKIYTIVDIGTYKIRCNIVQIEKDTVTILGYGEKKQEASDFESGELSNIKNVSKNLAIAIKKAEKEAKEETSTIIINAATFPVFHLKHVSQIEREAGKPIKKSELKEILKNLLFSFKNQDKPLQSGVFWTRDMKMILANIGEVVLDKKPVPNLLFHDGKDIKITMDQFFMQSGKYDVIQKMASDIDKKIELVIPYENSIKDLVLSLSNTEDFVVVNIGNRKTSIVIVVAGEIFTINYFNIGIGELISDISSSYKITEIKAIKTINEASNYKREKKSFYTIWEKAFKIMLEESLGNTICPHNFFMFGGGYNEFIEENIQHISFSNTRIKVAKTIALEKIDQSKKDFIQGKFQLDVKSNISLISMIISTRKYFRGSENEMIHMLQKLLRKS